MCLGLGPLSQAAAGAAAAAAAAAETSEMKTGFIIRLLQDCPTTFSWVKMLPSLQVRLHTSGTHNKNETWQD